MDIHIDPTGGLTKDLIGNEKYLCGEAITWQTRHSNRLDLVTCDICLSLFYAAKKE